MRFETIADEMMHGDFRVMIRAEIELTADKTWHLSTGLTVTR
jgi:hypothetical protein